MSKKLLISTTLAVLILPSAVNAASKSVSSPNIVENMQIENKGSYQFDDDQNSRWQNKTEFDYGLTDRIELTLEGEIEKRENESVEYKATAFKAKYKLTGDEYYLKSAIQVGYGINHLGDADDVGVKLNVQKTYGQWDQRANFDFGHEVGEGSESGIDAALKLGSYYKFDGYKLGGEYYADFGRLKDLSGFEDQEHHIGPVVAFDIPVAQTVIGAKLGYLAGLSDASADHVIKYELEYEF